MEDKETSSLYFTLAALLHDFVLCKPGQLKEDKKMNLLEYLLWNNLKLGKVAMMEINMICEGIYKLQDFITEAEGKDEYVNIEELAMWMRDSKGLWPYSVHLHSFIFDQSARGIILGLMETHDLFTF